MHTKAISPEPSGNSRDPQYVNEYLGLSFVPPLQMICTVDLSMIVHGLYNWRHSPKAKGTVACKNYTPCKDDRRLVATVEVNVLYPLTYDSMVIERLLFVIELDQDILRQAFAEDQEQIITGGSKSSGVSRLNP